MKRYKKLEEIIGADKLEEVYTQLVELDLLDQSKFFGREPQKVNPICDEKGKIYEHVIRYNELKDLFEQQHFKLSEEIK